ncbi:MAG: gliding motility-associated C-terminal domain-containing protein [Saprospiraceae bacterium]
MINIIKTIVTGFFLLITILQVQSQDAIFTLEDESAGVGSSFCMNVTAENLTNIVALQFSINWDETILELTSIEALNPNFAGANINTTGSASGISTFSFSSSSPSGVTMPAGDLFFRICFTVVGPGGSSALVDFTGTPTFIDVLANNNGVFTPMNLVTQGGNVTVPTPLIFTMPNEIYAPGASFCLPVSVTNFNDLESIQSAINWDASVLQYDSVTAFNLSDLDVSSFGVSNASTGLIGFSWNDNDNDPFNGVTVADGTTIFEMCFTVIGSVNDMTCIVFDDNPIPVEVIQFGNTDNLGLQSEGGKINIQQTIFITNSTLTQPNCYDADGGAINISVTGGTGPYTYLWSNDSTTQDLTGLDVGSYTVTITDSSMPANVFSSSFSLFGNFIAPTAMSETLDTISCAEPTTVLDGTGSSTGTDIIYEWIHGGGTATILGGNTLMATVNAVGSYDLIVTDTLNGCSATAFSFVEGDVVPPIVDAGEADTLNCAVTVLELDGTVDPIGNYTYAWTTIGGSFVMDQNTPNPTIDEEGTFIFTVTEVGTGCMATDTLEIALNNDTPTASAALGPDITCTNPEVTLDGSASSSGSLITYAWSGPGTITNENTTMPTVNAVGTYTLTIMNTYSQCTDEALVVVGANLVEPTVVVSDMNDEINCTTPSIMLDGTGSSTGDVTYLWTTIGGDIGSGETSLMPTVTTAGEYILTVTDTINGCTASDTTMVIQDADLPISNAGPDRILTCDILEVQLDGSNSSAGIEFKYLWTTTGTGNITSDPTSIAPFVDAGGVYTLQVLDTINNCTATSSMTVSLDTIAPIPNPVASGVLTCSLPQILLSQGTPVGNNIILGWDVIAGTIAGANAQGDLIIDSAGIFQLTLTNNDNGCKDSASIVVMQNIVEPIADAGEDFELDCGQTTATLDGSSSSTGTDYIYQWTALSGNAPGNPTTLTPTISSIGEYLIIVTDTINGCMNMDTVVVTESDDYPIVEAGANGTITCTNPEISLDASLVSSSGPGYFIEWVAADGSGVVIDGNENTLMPTINEPGAYILTITNTNNNCSATDQLFVSSNNTPPIAMVVQDTIEFDCDEPTAMLDGTGSTTTGVEYFWKTTDGNIAGGQGTLIAEANIGGTYMLCVTNTDNGCADTATVFVEPMNPAPILSVEFTSNITCSTPIVTLDASGTVLLPNQIFNWVTGPNGNYIPGTTDGFMPMVNTQAFYTLVVTDTITGCVYQDGALVLVDSSLVMASAMADGNIDCVTDLVNLEATVNASTMDVIYNWTASMGGNITSPDPTQLMIQVDAAGIYEFVALDTVTGCTDTISLEVLSDTDAPIADAGMETELPCTATSIFLDGSGSSTGDDFVYLWTTTGTGSIVTGTETNLNPEVDAIGTYTLTVTDTTNGCFATDQVNVISSQAVDAIAATPVNLDCGVISILLDGTGSTTGPTITYLWTQSNGGTIDLDEETLMPQVSSPGTYTLLVTDTQSGCTATTDVEVVFNNSLALADAGDDLAVCETTTNLEGNLPTDVTGIWLSLGSSIPTDPANPTTAVTNLQPGANVFIWTLSALGCPEYSSDTVIVTVDEISITNDDTYNMLENEVLDFDVSTNDVVGVGQFTDLTGVANGTLNNLGGGGFTYTPNLDFIGTETFEYEFCSDICLDACDTSLVTITVNVKDPLPIDSLLEQTINTITPNDDGLNDVFIFDILIQYPNEFVNNELIVFNRWGDIVYEAKPYNNDWGGTNQNGKPLPEGTYYYILRLDFAAGLILKGDVTILR